MKKSTVVVRIHVGGLYEQSSRIIKLGKYRQQPSSSQIVIHSFYILYQQIQADYELSQKWLGNGHFVPLSQCRAFGECFPYRHSSIHRKPFPTEMWGFTTNQSPASLRTSSHIHTHIVYYNIVGECNQCHPFVLSTVLIHYIFITTKNILSVS